MTYSELLHSVDFDEIAPYVAKYHGHDNCMAMYKIHYDILRQMTPHREEDDNKIVTISYYEPPFEDEEVEPGQLDAYPLELDFWEVSLAKEVIIAPEVTAPLAEVAACCLWHSSFIGFTPRQREESLREICGELEDEPDRVRDFIEMIRNGQSVIAPPPKKVLRKLRWARKSHVSIYETFVGDAGARYGYFKELILKYNAFAAARRSRCVVCLSSSSEHPVTAEELTLVELVAKGCKEVTSCVLVDDSLGSELKIDAAFY